MAKGPRVYPWVSIEFSHYFFKMSYFSLLVIWLLSACCSVFFFIVIAQFIDLANKPLPLTLTSGFLFITLFATPFVIYYKRKLNKEKRSYIASHQQDLDNPIIQIETINNINEVWKIIDQDEILLAPGFLFKTVENEYHSLITDNFLDYWPENDDEFLSDFIPKEIVIEKWITSQMDKELFLNGKRIPKPGYIPLSYLVNLLDTEELIRFLSFDLTHYPDDLELSEIIKKHATKEIGEYDI